MEMKTTLNSAYLPIQNPKGGIYRHQGKGGPGDKPWPKVWARLRPYCRKNAAMAVFSWPYGGRAHGACCRALSRLSPVGCRFRFLILGPWF